jgi:hypothetical protein
LDVPVLQWILYRPPTTNPEKSPALETQPRILVSNRTPPNPTEYDQAMRILEALATAFFRTFGITQPSDQALRRAVWFLFGLLAVIVFALGTATIIVLHIM